jgi:2-hydroxy-6-oxonona-2,4-dienedioate hydrolase
MRNDLRICARVGRQRCFHSKRQLLFAGFALATLLSTLGAAKARAELTTNGEIAGMRAQFADVNGVRTRYYEMGQGEPLVLVHGGGWSGHASANAWSKNIPLFAKQFHVFAPDKLGSGMTGNPTDDNDFNIQGEVDHIYDFIRAMKLGMVHLVGESRGGACVFFLALQHPEVVRDLVIVDSNEAAPEAAASVVKGLAQCPKQPDWEEWKCRIRAMSSAPDEAFDDEYFMAGKYMSLLPKSQETVAKLNARAGGELATTDGFNQWKAAWYERIRKEGALGMPVLIYWGRNDPAAALANGSALHDLIAAQNPHVQMIIQDKAGHFPFRESPEEFVSYVTNFIVDAEKPQISANPPDQTR